MEFITPLFSVVNPEKVQDLVRQYKGAIYPEHRFDDLLYVKKAKEQFERLSKINMTIQPLGR